jgi:hypothetical protein
MNLFKVARNAVSKDKFRFQDGALFCLQRLQQIGALSQLPTCFRDYLPIPSQFFCAGWFDLDLTYITSRIIAMVLGARRLRLPFFSSFFTVLNY